MERAYFINLLKAYCRKEHLNTMCPLCIKKLEDFDNNKLDKYIYYKLIAYNGYFFKRFHFHTFNRLSKRRFDDLTKN